jgi:hypothetical protein
MLEFSIITITAFVSILDTTLILIMKNFCKGDFKRFIPIFSIIFGIGLGIAGYYTENVEMGNNLVEAIFIGLSAGAAATGIDQVSKQLSKNDGTANASEYLKNFLQSIYVPEDVVSEDPNTNEENPEEKNEESSENEDASIDNEEE